MFHQSGGFCNGSAAMCQLEGGIHKGEQDVLIGKIEGCPFHRGAAQWQQSKQPHLVIDMVPARGAGFSLEAPEGVLFLPRSEILSKDPVLNWDDLLPPD
mgnify:CR=1 FL=1